MKYTEFYKDKQARPYASPFANTSGGSGIPANSIPQAILNMIYFYGIIDGGDLGEPTSAMDYLDYPLNGGAL